MKDEPLKIEPFKNRGGSISQRVSGTLLRHRVQKNFPTLGEAQGFRDALLKAAEQGESLPTRYAVTRFTNDEDLHDAELAHRKLKEKIPDASLMGAVSYYLEHHAVDVTIIPTTQAIDEYSEERRAQHVRENSITQSESVLRQFMREANVADTRAFTGTAAESWIRAPGISTRTQRDRYDLLVSFARFLRKKRHLVKWPFEGVVRPKHFKDPNIRYLRNDQCQRLLDAAAAHVHRGQCGALLPYVSLCIFSGLRPMEARRMGEDWSKINLEGRVASGFLPKARGPRSVELQAPLDAILARCKAAGLSPGVWSRKALAAIQTKAGIRPVITKDEEKRIQAENIIRRENKLPRLKMPTEWDNDILRHTYASNHFAVHGDYYYLVQNMGNSEEVLRASYINRTVLRVDAEKFFLLQPNWEQVGPLGKVAKAASVTNP